ncbi:MAG: cation diffusion facilitator family transporter [Eubacterium sp.]
MTKLLISFAKRKSKNNLRNTLGIMSGIVGIFCNLLLFTIKLVLGILTGSVSITADALNNLSDAASNIVTIVGTRLSVKPVDKEHPFGHGRLEYISALIVAFLIFLMGFELAKSSIDKILHPSQLNFSVVYIVIIVIAILVKVWMAYFNRKLYNITQNINLKAVSQDSLNDCISTGATIVAIVLCHFFNIPWFDGVIGLCVSVFILLSGVGIIKDILNPLLGQPPSQELVENIKSIMLSEELIFGVHDLIIHDYGPGRIIASAHAEVPSNVDVMKIHDVIDNVEQKIHKELNIIICIHMDPIVVNDEEVEKYKAMCDRIIKSYNPEYSFHDFRMVKGDTHTNLIFDVVTTFDKGYDKAKITKEITDLFKQEDETINLVMTLEHSYT